MARNAKQKANHVNHRNRSTQDRSTIASKRCAVDSRSTACKTLSRSNGSGGLYSRYKKTLWTLAVVACVNGCSVNRVTVSTNFKGYPIRLEVDMGVRTRAARQEWINNTATEAKRILRFAKMAILPELRAGGATAAEVAEGLGRHGLLVRQNQRGDIFAAYKLVDLGIVEVDANVTTGA